MKQLLIAYIATFISIIISTVNADYPCNNYGLMDQQYQSPCTNSATYSYNLKKTQDMGSSVLQTSNKIVISGWWKPTANPSLTTQWQTLFYLSRNTNGVTLPMNGQAELNGDSTTRLLAFWYNSQGANQLVADYNQATPVVIPNFQSTYLGKWSFYAFSLNYIAKTFKVAINPIDTSTVSIFSGSFTANIPTNFGDFPNLGLYFDATPAYFPSCSLMQGVFVTANYDFAVAQDILELRHSNLNLTAHYTLMAPNTLAPQFISDTQFSLPDMMLGTTRSVEAVLDPSWTSVGTYEQLFFTSGSTAILATTTEFKEESISYWMSINGNPAMFMNFLVTDSTASPILSFLYVAAGGGYTIKICISGTNCYTTPVIAAITGGGGSHEAIINVCQFPGAAQLFIRVFINGASAGTGYIAALWPTNLPAAYVLNNPAVPFTGTYTMRNFRIYSGSYFRQYMNDAGIYTFCMSNCNLQASKYLSDQSCVYCTSGFVQTNGVCWPSADYCPKANSSTPHSQPYQECTPCLNTFAQIQQQCTYDIDLNPLVVSGMPTTITSLVPGPDTPTTVTQAITFNPPLPAVPQIFLCMSTFDYDLGTLNQDFTLTANSVTTTGFNVVASRLTVGSGSIYSLQPFYIASNDPDIEIGTFVFTSAAYPNLANVATSNQWVSQIINFSKRQKFLPQVSAGYTGIKIPGGTGHSFQITTQTIDTDRFLLSVMAYKGIPIQRIEIYWISMRPEIPVYNIFKNFMQTDEQRIYSQNLCPSDARICYYTGPAGKVPPSTIYMSVINVFNQTASQNNIRRHLTYQGIDTSKSTFSFEYLTWCNSMTSQFGIQSFALVKPCVKFYCNCDPVPPGYFSIPTSYACWQCDFVCQYCTTSSSNCTQCKGNRINAPTCSCPTGTYEDYTSTNCPSCKNGCASCVGSPTNCLSNCLGARTGPTCTCPAGTVDDGTNNCPSDTNIGCDPKCARCSVLDSTKCSVCAPGRIANAANPWQCDCPAGQVDVNNLCQNCHPRCNGCTGIQPYQCIACNGTTRINPPACTCKSGYYDDGINIECQPCNSFCTTCNGASSSSCIVCAPNRTLNILTSKCDCPSGTYDSGLPICPACNVQCSSCTSASACSVCAGDRTGAPSCTTCPAGKYSGTTANCSNCGYKCATCTTSALNCTACTGQYRNSNPPTCDCKTGYYDSGVADCQQCDSNCKTCSTNSTTCLTCFDNRVLDPTTKKCVCPTNFYEVVGQSQCLACDTRCSQCTASGCIGCAQNRQLASPTCTCPFGTFDNYPTQVVCPACNPVCNGCATSASSCINCQGLRSNSPACDTCPTGMYATTTAPDFCANCDSVCSTCSTTSSNCTACTGYRVKVPVSGSSTYTCVCQNGTYQDATSTQCRTCDSTCATCQGGSRLDCLSCNTGFVQLTSGAGACTCPAGTYMTTNGQQCQSCDYKCLTCKGPSSSDCITCRVASDCVKVDPQPPIVVPTIDICKAYGVMSDTKCDCPDNQFYSTAQKQCITCATNCKRCYGSTISQCIECAAGYIVQGNSCVLVITSEESSKTLDWLIITFFGLLSLLVFPFIYQYFMKKIMTEYLAKKNKVEIDSNDDELNLRQQNQSNQEMSIRNFQ